VVNPVVWDAKGESIFLLADKITEQLVISSSLSDLYQDLFQISSGLRAEGPNALIDSL